MTEREIFLEALEMSTPEARAAYLQDACRQDVSLRHNVEELLKEHFANDSLLAGPALDGERARIRLEPAREAAPAQMLGRYKLLEKIGEGGFGEVWMAEQREPVKRRVALKIIKPGMDSRQIVARFEAERQALAMMDHANIAKIFDAGVTETGRPYFVMELVRGMKITDYCDQNQLPTGERLNLFILVCHAIQHAHQKGIIHRDIKPSNILVTLHDAVPVPKVIDFGIAKATQQDLTDKTVFTQFQQFIGTPAYISPEQAEMSGLDLDTRADIYSLGVLLYELLVGQTPFDAKEIMQGGLDGLRQIIREKEPLRPSTKLNTLQGGARTTAGKRRRSDVEKLVHQLQGDLDWIVMKCLEKDRTRRYETANGLAADIQRHLANEPVIARPPSTAYKLQKAWRRNKLAFSAAATVLCVLIVGVVGSTSQALRATRAEREQSRLREDAERLRANEARLRQEAEAAEARSQQQLYAALLEQAHATVLTGKLGQRERALDAIRRATAISNSPALRGAAVSALALPDLRFERQLPIADASGVHFDAAFERVAICRSNSPVEIRSVPDLQLLSILPASTNRPAFGGTWSPDGRFFALHRDLDGAGRLKDIEVWDVARTNRVLLLRATPLGAFTFHPQLPRIMVGRAPNAIVTWDLEIGEEIGRHQVEGQPAVLKLSPNGDLFATAEASGRKWKVAIYDVASGASRTNQLFAERVTDLNWHPTGRWVAIPDHGGDVHLLDSQTGAIRLLGQHTSDAVVTVFSPDGRYLFTGGWDRRLICWDLNTMRRAFAIELDSYRIQFRADGRQCAIIWWPEVRVQLHAFELPALHREFAEDLGGHRNFAAFSPDRQWLAASGAGEHMVVWNLDGTGPGALVKKLGDLRVSFAPNGELFANRLGDASRWRLTKGTNGAVIMQRRPLAKPSGLFSLCLVSNGVVFTSDKGSKFSAFDQLETPLPNWKATIGAWNGASPDGRWLGVYHPNSPHLSVYGLPGFQRVARLTNQARISQFEFSPRGDEVAVASRSGVEFWSTTTWQRTRHLTNFGGILYSPDARTFWLWTRLSTGSLHDARTGETLLPLPENTRPIAVSADGRRLAVAVDARRAQVWDLEEVRQRLRDLGLDWTERR